jgi:S-adenosylmethionine decarboxylase
MKDLAPSITRQRLLIEGFFSIDVNRQTIEQFFLEITDYLHLRMYGKPIIFSPDGLGKEGNQGYDAFVPLIDSGISLYVWSESKFLSIIIYTCKSFNAEKAIEKTADYFKIDRMEYKEF